MKIKSLNSKEQLESIKTPNNRASGYIKPLSENLNSVIKDPVFSKLSNIQTVQIVFSTVTQKQAEDL